jgi:subtilisin-like proprotein convertase family protein
MLPPGPLAALLNQPRTGESFLHTLIVGVGPPYSGTFIPEFPLAAFKGQNANGVWTVTVIDRFAGETGNVRAFSLVITSY